MARNKKSVTLHRIGAFSALTLAEARNFRFGSQAVIPASLP